MNISVMVTFQWSFGCALVQDSYTKQALPSVVRRQHNQKHLPEVTSTPFSAAGSTMN
jgi:hypothetical protein